MATRLQILQKERLKLIQERINQYGMRFPVAEINEKLGTDMGNLSNMLKGKKPISDNFYTSFCEMFPEKAIENNSNNVVEEPKVQYGPIDYQAELIRVLKEQNQWLKERIDASLTALSTDVNNNAAAIRAEIRGYAQRQILKEVNEDDEAFLKAKAEADKIYLLNLKQLLGNNKENAHT